MTDGFSICRDTGELDDDADLERMRREFIESQYNQALERDAENEDRDDDDDMERDDDDDDDLERDDDDMERDDDDDDDDMERDDDDDDKRRDDDDDDLWERAEDDNESVWERADDDDADVWERADDSMMTQRDADTDTRIDRDTAWYDSMAASREASFSGNPGSAYANMNSGMQRDASSEKEARADRWGYYNMVGREAEAAAPQFGNQGIFAAREANPGWYDILADRDTGAGQEPGNYDRLWERGAGNSGSENWGHLYDMASTLQRDADANQENRVDRWGNQNNQPDAGFQMQNMAQRDSSGNDQVGADTWHGFVDKMASRDVGGLNAESRKDSGSVVQRSINSLETETDNRKTLNLKDRAEDRGADEDSERERDAATDEDAQNDRWAEWYDNLAERSERDDDDDDDLIERKKRDADRVDLLRREKRRAHKKKHKKAEKWKLWNDRTARKAHKHHDHRKERWEDDDFDARDLDDDLSARDADDERQDRWGYTYDDLAERDDQHVSYEDLKTREMLHDDTDFEREVALNGAWNDDAGG